MEGQFDRLIIMVACLLSVLVATSQTDAMLVNTKIDRIIDLSSQLVKITERFHLSEPTATYIIKLDELHKKHLAYIDATLNGQAIPLQAKPDASFEADLAGQSISQPLVVTTVYTRLLQPYPAEITQSERQLVRYEGTLATLSPYLTKTTTTKIKLPQSSRLESFTKASKMTTGSNKLVYGAFQDVQPNTAEPLSIHYENNNPFVAVKHLTRTIEISPWSRSIHVVNEVKVQHVGAKLKGPFSRFDYQRDHANGISSVRSFLAEIPKSSKDIFFRDAIGNISTSTVKTTSAKTIIGIKPRFPLFGGWVTDFVLGYSVPIADFINEPVSGNNYRLSINFADILYENMFIEGATVRVIFASGTSNIDVKNHIGFDQLPVESGYSYLDVIGRPIVTLKKQNLVSLHLEGKPLVVRYNYSKMYMLQEPVLLVAAIVGIFLLCTIYSKLFQNNQKSTQKQKPE